MSRASITSSSKWMFVGTLVSKPFQLVTVIVIARMLGPESFGVFGLVTSLSVTLAMIFGLGLGDASYKYVAEHYHADKQEGARFSSVIVWTAMSFATLLSFVLWALRDYWSTEVFSTSVPLLLLASCLTLGWLNLLLSLLSGVLSGLQQFKSLAILSIVQVVAVGLFAAFGTYNSETAVMAYLAGALISVCWATLKLLQYDRSLLAWPGWGSFAKLKGIIRFSAPMWIGAFALTPVVTFVLAFVAHQPNGEHHLGIYSTANGLRLLVAFLPGVIAVVITPFLVQEGGSHGDVIRYRELLQKSFSAFTFFTVPILIAAVFASDLIFKVYGSAYSGSFRLFVPIAGAAAIGAIGTPLTIIMLAKNRTWWSLFFGVVKSAVLVFLSLLLVPTYLSTGLVWASLISESVFYLIAFEYCRAIRALPGVSRSSFYLVLVVVALVAISALALPQTARWLLALPVAMAVALFLLKRDRDLVRWLIDIVPAKFQPPAKRIFDLLAAQS
jgi:O-antigen/teichoic acid export membrane protein